MEDFNLGMRITRLPSLILAVLLILAMLLLLVPADIANADSLWNYRRPITITNSSGTALTNHQVQVTLTTATMGNPYTHVNADGSDIRFVNEAGTTQYDYWIQSWDNTGNSVIWVEVPSIPTGSSTMYMWYGDPGATTASDRDATFIFYETFPNADAAWDGSTDTAQDEAGWVTIQDTITPDPDDVRVDNLGWTIGTLPPSGGNHLTFNDADAGNLSSPTNDLAYVPIDLSGCTDTGVVITYYWQSDDVDPSEGMASSYSKNSTNGVDGTWTQIASHINPVDDNWYQQTYNLAGGDCVAGFKLRFAAYTTSTAENMFADDVYIRKYASTQPTTSVGNEEKPYTWYLSGTAAGSSYVMYKEDASKTSTTVTVSDDGSQVFSADEAAQFNLGFAADTWTGYITFDGASSDTTVRVYVGSWNGSVFTAASGYDDVSGSSAFSFSAGAFDVPQGDWLALKVEDNTDGDANSAIVSVGSNSSYLSTPGSAPEYPVPDVGAWLMFAAGLAVVGWFIFRIRQNKNRRLIT